MKKAHTGKDCNINFFIVPSILLYRCYLWIVNLTNCINLSQLLNTILSCIKSVVASMNTFILGAYQKVFSNKQVVLFCNKNLNTINPMSTILIHIINLQSHPRTLHIVCNILVYFSIHVAHGLYMLCNQYGGLFPLSSFNLHASHLSLSFFHFLYFLLDNLSQGSLQWVIK